MVGVTEPPSQQPTLKSQRLISGRYRLRRVIGRGAMGVVWLAYDEVLHRSVAVKEVQLPPGMPSEEANEARERTLREARAIAALTHPNVVAVHDVARQGVEPFVVMELVPGRSLAQVISKSGHLNTEQAALVADAVASALEAAHRRGITHRDVKPGNVLVGEDGQVKLTDFGISRNVSEVTMTSSGLILGTPAYIAPEVAAGEPVTATSDLWGLGATLFAAVEGHPPYESDNPLDTINEVVHGDVPQPTEGNPLADVITGLMVKEPAERMSLVEVRRRIRPLLPDPGSMVFPPDESEEDDAGPADNKPTTSLSASEPKPDGPTPGSGVPLLAADPGPLPFELSPGFGSTPAFESRSTPSFVPGFGSSQGFTPAPGFVPTPVGASAPLAPAPGPLPFVQPPVRRRRGRFATSLLLVLAIVLFAGAAGGGFVAARTLAGQRLLPPPGAQPTPNLPQAPPVTSFVTATGQATVASGTPGGNFQVSVPTGWVQFVEQRGEQELLPESTAVLWINADGTNELGVELFRDYFSNDGYNYTQALRQADPKGNSFSQVGSTDEYMFRTSTTSRSMYYRLVRNGVDLWVVSLTVPDVQESAANSGLFDRIQQSFRITS